MTNLTIAIPTMRRWSFLKTMIPVFLERPEVNEVVICDETGEDYDEIRLAFGTHPMDKKLRLYKNETRLGIYENKRKVLSLCKKGWIALLDSDNVFPDEWFDFLSELDFTNTKRIYGSADFRTLDTASGKMERPCVQFSGTVLDKSLWNSFLQNEKCFYLLNDGNWILHSECLRCLPDTVKSEDVLAADAIFMLRRFVMSGYYIHYPSGFEYIHMTHPGSSWIQTEKASLKVLLGTDWRI